MATAVAASTACSTLAESVVDAAVELHTDLGGLSATCLARAAQSLCGTTHLAQLGLNGDAMSVARTIVELAIDLAYIASDPTRLVPMFVDYSHVREWELAQAVDRLHGGTVDRDAMRVLRERRARYLEQNPDSDRNWAGISLKRRAERVAGTAEVRAAHVQMYDLLYADMCGASHSGHVTLKYTLVGDPGAPSIHFGPMEPDTKPIMLAFGAMLQMIKTVIETCHLTGFEERFDAMNAIMAGAARPESPL